MAIVLLAPAAQPSWLEPQKPQRPRQSDYRKMAKGLAEKSDDLLDRFAKGDIDARQWSEDFYNLIKGGHREAWRLGRQRAGDFTGNTIEDALIGRSVADGQSDYIHGFAERLASGRYGEGEEFNHTLARSHANLYLKQTRGTANEAFTQSSPDDAEFDWVLGATEKHCTDCPTYAEMNPWRKDEIVTNPGQGETPCLSNCLCHWQRDDGIASFKPVDLN